MNSILDTKELPNLTRIVDGRILLLVNGSSAYPSYMPLASPDREKSDTVWAVMGKPVTLKGVAEDDIGQAVGVSWWFLYTGTEQEAKAKGRSVFVSVYCGIASAETVTIYKKFLEDEQFKPSYFICRGERGDPSAPFDSSKYVLERGLQWHVFEGSRVAAEIRGKAVFGDDFFVTTYARLSDIIIWNKQIYEAEAAAHRSEKKEEQEKPFTPGRENPWLIIQRNRYEHIPGVKNRHAFCGQDYWVVSRGSKWFLYQGSKELARIAGVDRLGVGSYVGSATNNELEIWKRALEDNNFASGRSHHIHQTRVRTHCSRVHYYDDENYPAEVEGPLKTTIPDED